VRTVEGGENGRGWEKEVREIGETLLYVRRGWLISRLAIDKALVVVLCITGCCGTLISLSPGFSYVDLVNRQGHNYALVCGAMGPWCSHCDQPSVSLYP